MEELFEGLEFGTTVDSSTDYIEVTGSVETPVTQGDGAGTQKASDGTTQEPAATGTAPGLGMPKELEDLLIEVDLNTKKPEAKSTKTGEEQNITESQKTDPSSNPDSSSSSKFKMLAKALSDEGVLSEISDDEWANLVKDEGDEYKALVSLQQKEIEKGISEYKSSLTDEERALYEGKDAGVNLGELGQLDKALNIYKGISDEDLESDKIDDHLRKAIITEDLRIRGFGDDEIAEELQLYEDTDKLASKSKNAKSRIIKHVEGERNVLIESQRLQQAENTKRYEESIKELKNNINSKEEIIPGIKLTPKAKDDLYKSMTTPVTEKDGVKIDALRANREKNPEMFDVVMHYFNSIGLFNFDKDGAYKPDLSKFDKEAQSRAAKDLEKALNTDTFSSGNSSNHSNENSFSLDGAL